MKDAHKYRQADINKAFELGAHAMSVRIEALAMKCKTFQEVLAMISEEKLSGAKSLNSGALLIYHNLLHR